MNTQKILYTLIDREFNVKNTTCRTSALFWIHNLYNRKGELMTRSVLFDTLGPQGLGTINLYEEGNTDKEWSFKLTRSQLTIE